MRRNARSPNALGEIIEVSTTGPTRPLRIEARTSARAARISPTHSSWGADDVSDSSSFSSTSCTAGSWRSSALGSPAPSGADGRAGGGRSDDRVMPESILARPPIARSPRAFHRPCTGERSPFVTCARARPTNAQTAVPPAGRVGEHWYRLGLACVGTGRAKDTDPRPRLKPRRLAAQYLQESKVSKRAESQNERGQKPRRLIHVRATTPAMAQYEEAKRQHPDALDLLSDGRLLRDVS